MNMTETEYNNPNGKRSNINDSIKVIHIKDSVGKFVVQFIFMQIMQIT